MNQMESFIPPSVNKADKMLGVIRACRSELPGGSVAAEIFGWFIRPPLERRAEQWQAAVAEILHRLMTERSVDLESLREDEGFVDTLLHATHVALRSAQAEKRDALRDAILHSALPSAPAEAWRHMYLHYIDEFNVWHLRMMKLFSNPVLWFKINNRVWPNLLGSPSSRVLEEAYPELKPARDFYDQVWHDLKIRGLVGPTSLHSMCTDAGLKQGLTTPYGNQFLAFISEQPTEMGQQAR